MSPKAITKTTAIVIIVAVIIVGIGIGLLLTTQPKPPTGTQTTTPSAGLVTLQIGNAQIRVPQDFYDFVQKAKSGEVSVTIYFGNALAPEERPGFYKVINAFQQEYPGIKVEKKEYGGSGDMQSAVVAAASLPKEQRESLIGTAPDVFTWAHDWVGWMADSGYLVALEDYLGPDAIEDISGYLLSSALASVTYKTKTYGLPYAGEALALYVNLNLVNNPPTTFEEMKQIMQQFYNPSQGTYGIAGQVSGMYHLNAWISAFNGFFYDDVTKQLGFTKPETKQGLEFFVQNILRYMDVTDLSHDYQRRLWANGKAPFYISGPWDVSFAISNFGLNGFTVVPLPTIEGNKVPRPWSGFRNMYITVMAETGGKERTYASILLVLYVALNHDSVLTLVNENGYVPVLKSVAEYVSNNLQANQLYKIVLGFYNQLARSTPMPKDKNMQVVWGADTYLQAIWQTYYNAISSGESVDSAVQAALGQIDEALQQAYNNISPKIS